MKLILEAKVVNGQKYGRKIGYPTANLDGRSTKKTGKEMRAGVYAGLVRRQKNQKVYKAAIVARLRHNRRHLQIEAFLINFNGSLYGERLRLELKKFIRPFKKISNEKNLKGQIDRDVEKILYYLS